MLHRRVSMQAPLTLPEGSTAPNVSIHKSQFALHGSRSQRIAMRCSPWRRGPAYRCPAHPIKWPTIRNDLVRLGQINQKGALRRLLTTVVRAITALVDFRVYAAQFLLCGYFLVPCGSVVFARWVGPLNLGQQIGS